MVCGNVKFIINTKTIVTSETFGSTHRPLSSSVIAHDMNPKPMLVTTEKLSGTARLIITCGICSVFVVPVDTKQIPDQRAGQ